MSLPRPSPASRSPDRRSRAFSLIELMVVVAIISVLAAVAVPTFVRYVRNTRTTEAAQAVRKIYVGARAYLLDETAARGTATLAPRFPDAVAPTPGFQCCTVGGKCRPNQDDWSDPTWVALKFSMDDPFYYQYAFDSSGTGSGAAFTARAVGNLDCDEDLSTFEMAGSFDGEEITGQASIFRRDPTE